MRDKPSLPLRLGVFARDHFLPPGIFIAAVVFYTFTLNTGVQPADSGELQLAALTLGVPHPPGYPLFTMLGWLFSHLPMGSPLAGISFLSVMASAGALALVFLAVRAVSFPSQREGLGVGMIVGLLAVLMLATSTTFWAQATTTNIRSLSVFFTALMVYAVAKTSQVGDQNLSSQGFIRQPARLFMAAFGLGVAHHVSLVFVGVVLGVYLLWRIKDDGRRTIDDKAPIVHRLSSIVLIVLIFLSTQLVWLYLPLRNAAPGPLAHGDLTTLSGFLDHVLARGFGGDFFYFLRVEPERFFDRLALIPDLLLFQFSPPVLLAALVGWVILLVRKRALGVALLAAFGLHLFITITYRAPQTVEYALPAWLILCVGAGMGWASIPQPTTNNQQRLLVVGCWLMMFGLAAFLGRDLITRWPSFAQLSQPDPNAALAQNALVAAQPNGVILAQWHQVTPMWVLQSQGVAPAAQAKYVYPDGAQKYEDTFADRALAEAQSGKPVFVTTFYAPQFSSRGLCQRNTNTPNLWQVVMCNAPAPRLAEQVIFDNRIAVIPPFGMAQTAQVGGALVVPARWRLDGAANEGESLTFRIFRKDGRLAANADVRLTNPIPNTQYESTLVLPIPLDLEPGEYALVVGAYRPKQAGGFEVIQGVTARGSAMEYAPLAVLNITPAARPIATTRPQNDPLVGVDYDLGIPGQMRLYTQWRLDGAAHQVVLQDAAGNGLASRTLPPGDGYLALVFDAPPQRGLRVKVDSSAPFALPDVAEGERYVPFGDQMALVGAATSRAGGTLKVDVRWLAGQAITTDYKVSVRVEGNGFYAQHDGTPALGAIPTLKWIRGTMVMDRHPVEVGAYAGLLRADVRVYDNFTQLPLPMLDERYEREGRPVVEVK
ncbi:MAG: DUF2723 domain-containing protein [Anaerolineae bacterium]